MTDLGAYLLMYVDGWSRGANDKPPRFADPSYRKGHQDGLRDRYRAIELECEKMGVPMSIETARSLIAEASTTARPANDGSSALVSPEPVSLTLAPLDPLSERFSEIRDRYMRSTEVPVGARVEPEFKKDGTRVDGETATHALKHVARRALVPSVASIEPTNGATDHDDMRNDFDY